MNNQSKLQQKLLDKVFVYTAETTPPDASNKETLLKNVMPLKGVADAVNVTDSPGAKVHMSSLTASIILAQNDIDPILQLTVRDRNRLALQGDLVGASALGVNNILCLGGDDPKNGDQPETKIVNDIDSLTLVSTANMMRKEKKFPLGREIDPPPKLFIGGAEVPTQGKPNPNKILNKINNGVDFFQTQYVFDAKVLSEYMKVLGDEGILEKTKELLTLTKVLEKMPDVTFYWVGDGPYRDDVLPILEKFDNFKWLGALEYPDKVRDFLTEIDVYVLLSGIDMSPLTLLEAQLMEKPVIATNVGGIPELMKNNETGFLIEKSDHQTLIEKLELILNDLPKANGMGKAGKEFVSSNFSWKIITKNFVDITNEYTN